jgi:hypothetical protein
VFWVGVLLIPKRRAVYFALFLLSEVWFNGHSIEEATVFWRVCPSDDTLHTI